MYKINHRNKLGRVINLLNLTGIGIEIGVKRGDFSSILLNNSSLSKIILLDNWKYNEDYMDIANVSQKMQDYYYKLVCDRFKHEKRIIIMKDDAQTVYKEFEDEYFEFIYHDANHCYLFVKQQLEAWYPKLRKGGIMAGHDYFNGNYKELGEFGVKQAVDEFVEKYKLSLNLTSEEQGKSWWFLK